MKNLPEHEAFRALEKRLANYTEEPDDDLWQKIAGETPSRKPVWAPWLNRASAVAVLVALGWAVTMPTPEGARVSPENDLAGEAQQQGAGHAAKELAIEKHAAAEDKASTLGKDMDQFASSAQQQKELTDASSERAGASGVAPPVSDNYASGNSRRRGNEPVSVGSSGKIGAKPSEGALLATSASGQYSESSSPVKSSKENEVTQTGAEEKALVSTTDESLSANANAVVNASKINTEVTPRDTPHDSVQFVEPLRKADSAAAPAELNKEPYNKKKKKRTPISVYALLTPSVSFQTVSPLSQDEVVIQKFSNPPMFSGDRLGFSFEAGIQGRLTEKFEYVGGLSFYHQSQTLQYTYQTGNVIVESGDDDLSFVATPETAQKSVRYSMQNIGVQAGLLYTLKEHRLTHKVGVMLQFQQGLSKERDGEAYNNAASNYLNYQLLYRVELEIGPRLTFVLQPSLGRTLKANGSLDAPFTLKQYRPGIGIGLIYVWERRRK
ncbi:hypothetical protein [Chryseolinea lacunae]|uniref:Outer membrane protein beta-barrel domain-containing protein n=1 Tax=Chryseolinea lacunae TaxID=2801331 RepID=A0ABS1L2I4_9BACT|nr:hypothetical protein [Chryseolinea lacunae]MBL0745899.1 hypothetical protein [Chryseolinea lacunae]